MKSIEWIALCVVLIIVTFGHHYIAHGYPFDTHDFLALASHEFVIAILAVFVFVLVLRGRFRI